MSKYKRTLDTLKQQINEKKLEKSAADPCEKGWVQRGMKTKNGQKVPNCIPQNTEMNERELTDAEMEKREEVMKELKKKEQEFKDRYGDDYKSAMYGIATKIAKGQSVDEAMAIQQGVPTANINITNQPHAKTPGARHGAVGPHNEQKQITENHKTNEDLRLAEYWDSREAANFVYQLTSQLGYPDEMTSYRAIWHQVDGFKRIEVKDEYVLHTSPAPHHDFVYCFIDLQVSPELATPLVESSGSILLDLLKNEVGARCGSLTANAVTLQYVIDVVEGNVEPSPDEYGQRIMSIKGDDPVLNPAVKWWPDTTGEIK